MGKFLRTVLIGVGIGLLIAPRRGQETRQLVQQRIQQLRDSISGTSQQSYTSSQISGQSRVSSTTRQMKHVAEVAEQHPHMYTPPTATYTPAYPEYVNPESTTER